MTELDMDSTTRTALQGAVSAVQGSQVKLTFRSPGRYIGGASPYHEVTMATKRMMVEGAV